MALKIGEVAERGGVNGVTSRILKEEFPYAFPTRMVSPA